MFVNVIVTPQFFFQKGIVRGRIVVDPESLVNAIYYNTIFESKDPMVVNMKKQVNSVKSSCITNNQDYNIYLEDGVVEKNFMKMDIRYLLVC